MREHPGVLDDRPMAAERVRITLDLAIDGERISGRVDDGRGEPDSFLGWLGLFCALDRLLERTGVRESPPDPGS